MNDDDILDGILDQFAVAYKKSPDALGEFLKKYPWNASDLLDYAHELNLLFLSMRIEITAEEEAKIDAEVVRMHELRRSPLVLVCTECSGLCTADRAGYAARQIAFCPCGQRALPQDEAYFERRNAARLGSEPGCAGNGS